MGVDWAALEEAIRKSALRQAKEIIDNHPGDVFYAVALDGVSTEPAARIELPVLALNSEQALRRDLRLNAPVPEDEPEPAGDPAPAEDTRGGFSEDGSDFQSELHDVVVSGTEDIILHEAGPEAEAEAEEGNVDASAAEEDTESLDDLLGEDLEEEPAEDGSNFYSTRWNPPEWHWCSMELFDESASELWSEALTSVARRHGWEETVRRYYRMLVSITIDVGRELAVGRNSNLIAYVSDEDHADQLLRACLTPEQLATHFPDLAALPADLPRS
ncbi:hypothetical protein [Arthrobacter ginkgonis]|uniref:hypothetical protein n=1 Tax=Arthrobacter ginkgonis TaxID=1630594 RepID=UPI0031E7DD1C